MKTLLALLLENVAGRVEQEVKQTLAPVPGYLKHLGFGALLIVVSAIGWSGLFVFLGLAAFFGLAHLPVLAVASLWTAGAYLLLGVALTMSGNLMLRKPR